MEEPPPSPPPLPRLCPAPTPAPPGPPRAPSVQTPPSPSCPEPRSGAACSPPSVPLHAPHFGRTPQTRRGLRGVCGRGAGRKRRQAPSAEEGRGPSAARPPLADAAPLRPRGPLPPAPAGQGGTWVLVASTPPRRRVRGENPRLRMGRVGDCDAESHRQVCVSDPSAVGTGDARAACLLPPASASATLPGVPGPEGGRAKRVPTGL